MLVVVLHVFDAAFKGTSQITKGIGPKQVLFMLLFGCFHDTFSVKFGVLLEIIFLGFMKNLRFLLKGA